MKKFEMLEDYEVKEIKNARTREDAEQIGQHIYFNHQVNAPHSNYERYTAEVDNEIRRAINELFPKKEEKK